MNVLDTGLVSVKVNVADFVTPMSSVCPCRFQVNVKSAAPIPTRFVGLIVRLPMFLVPVFCMLTVFDIGMPSSAPPQVMLVGVSVTLYVTKFPLVGIVARV